MKILLLLFLSVSVSYAQYNHRSIHPDLEGAALESALVEDFKPAFVLDLRQARDTLYRRIHLENDSVRCVYSGLSRYLDLNADPSEFLFQSGGNENINLEHCYPQAKGAGSGNPQADMHHLFPTRVPVNTARANNPFREIPDNQSSSWFYRSITQSNTPSRNIDFFAESNNGGFEPREDFKGNVARAYFYFYTVYRAEADADDPNFFDLQLSTLCDWHEADPVDSLEWVRSLRIAEYQDGKANPFVLDCRLARLYCGETSTACNLVDNQDLRLANLNLQSTVVAAGTHVQLEDDGLGRDLKSSFFTLDGRLVSDTIVTPSGQVEAPIQPGMYLLVVQKSSQLLLTSKVVVY